MLGPWLRRINSSLDSNSLKRLSDYPRRYPTPIPREVRSAAHGNAPRASRTAKATGGKPVTIDDVAFRVAEALNRHGFEF
jgi:hypothetical protein